MTTNSSSCHYVQIIYEANWKGTRWPVWFISNSRLTTSKLQCVWCQLNFLCQNRINSHNFKPWYRVKCDCDWVSNRHSCGFIVYAIIQSDNNTYCSQTLCWYSPFIWRKHLNLTRFICEYEYKMNSMFFLTFLFWFIYICITCLNLSMPYILVSLNSVCYWDDVGKKESNTIRNCYYTYTMYK